MIRIDDFSRCSNCLHSVYGEDGVVAGIFVYEAVKCINSNAEVLYDMDNRHMIICELAQARIERFAAALDRSKQKYSNWRPMVIKDPNGEYTVKFFPCTPTKVADKSFSDRTSS